MTEQADSPNNEQAARLIPDDSPNNEKVARPIPDDDRTTEQADSSNDELPDWWKTPDPRYHPVQSVLFRALCLISMQRSTLDEDWKSKIDQDEWEKHRTMIIGRLNNTNLASGLVLTSSVVFISTQPPLTSFLPYTIHGCYILALSSFAHALGSLLSGLAVVNIYQGCDREWAREVLCGTRFRLCCTLLFISWPIVSLTTSLLFLIFSLLVACYASGVGWFQFLITIELLFLVWLPVAFVWCALEMTLPEGRRKVLNDKRKSRNGMKVDEPKQTHLSLLLQDVGSSVGSSVGSRRSLTAKDVCMVV